MLSRLEQIRSPAVALAPVDVRPAVDLWTVAVEIAGRDDAARGQPRQEPLDDAQLDVRKRDVRLGQNLRQRVRAACGELDAVDTGVRRRRVDGGFVEVDAENRRKAELRGCDRQDARAAAD